MKLQNIILPSPETCTVEDLYMRRSGRAEFTWADALVHLHVGSSIYFDTYFNSFSIGKWKKYTRIGKVYIALKFSGKLRVTLVRKERVGHEVLNHYIKEEIVESNGEEKSLCFDDPYSAGIYSMDLFAISETTFYGGYYWTDLPEKEADHVKIALDICTFKREHFVRKNLGLIQNRIFESGKYNEFKDALEIFIVDNAKTLEEKDGQMKCVHIFPNRNVGGSGGFTRGLIEIKKASEKLGITHALLMDDDIVIEPESLYRTWTLLSLLKEEYKDAFVGGAMLRLDHQNIQVECGAVWNGGELIGRKCGLDLRGVEPCLYNEVEETVDYSAWWYTALPLTVVQEDNLPVPIFIRGDDVEYGMRNARRIITMNGICVWHEPFENKYSSTMFYYILRNRLIDNALHDQIIDKERFIDILYHQVMEQLYLYRYKNARLLMMGVDDYLKGIEWFKEQDGEALHKKVMENGYKMQYMEDIGATFDYGAYENAFREPEILSFKHRLIKKLTINGILMKPKRWNVVIPLIGSREINVYRAENVVNYDALTQKGFVTKRDPEEAKACLQFFKKIKKEVNEKYEKINEEYKSRGKELMTSQFWKKYLEI